MAITSVEDIYRVTEKKDYNLFIINEELVLSPPDDRFIIINEWLEASEFSNYPTELNAEEIEILNPFVIKIDHLRAVRNWRAAGQFILDEVSILLAQKAPTPSEGLANLAALETVDKLLSRGDLRVAKAALEAADLTGTSFDGDSDSYDYIIGLLDQKIAELTP